MRKTSNNIVAPVIAVGVLLPCCPAAHVVILSQINFAAILASIPSCKRQYLIFDTKKTRKNTKIGQIAQSFLKLATKLGVDKWEFSLILRSYS